MKSRSAEVEHRFIGVARDDFQIKCSLKDAPRHFRFRANIDDDVYHRLINDPPFASDAGDGSVIATPWGWRARGEVPGHLQDTLNRLITEYRRIDFLALVRCGVVTLRGVDKHNRLQEIDRKIIEGCFFDWDKNVIVLPDLRQISEVEAIGPEISYFCDPREAARIDEAVALIRARGERLLKSRATPRTLLDVIVRAPHLPQSLNHLPSNARDMLPDDDGSARRALKWAREFIEPVRHLIFSSADLLAVYARAKESWRQQRREKDTERKRKSRALQRKRKSLPARGKRRKRRVR